MKTLFRRWLALSGSAVLACSAQGQDYSDYQYRTTENRIDITRYIGPGGQVTIPPEINGIPVAWVGYEAFRDCQDLLSVRIPDSVTGIADRAFFGCVNLTNVILSANTTFLCPGAFGGCASLASLDIPDSLTNLDNSVFYVCTNLSALNAGPGHPAYSSGGGVLFNKDQTTLVICPVGKAGGYTVPSSVTNICAKAFSGCGRITQLVIPDSVGDIGIGWFGYDGLESTFAGCTSLSAIDVNPANPAYSSVDGVLFDKSQTTLLQYPPGRAGTYAVPEGVTSIGTGWSLWVYSGWFAFAGCAKMTEIAIPESVTNIAGFAFYQCTALATAPIPTNVYALGECAFEGCSNLAAITIPGNVTEIGYRAFAGCSRLPGVVVPDRTTYLGPAAFYACTEMTNVIIGDGVTRLFDRPTGFEHGPGVFQSCTALTSVHLGRSVTNIGRYAFSGCTRLANIIIPENVTRIGEGAFLDCSRLTSITIGRSLTSIELDGLLSPFYGCACLTAIEVDPKNPMYSSVDGVLFSKDLSSLLQCPMGKTGSYVIPSGVTELGRFPFCGCTGLTSITVPDTITSLEYTFFNCANLSVHFEGNAPAFGGYDPFAGTTNAAVLYLPGSEGWAATFAGRPTALWLPVLLADDSSFGVRTNQFGFNIDWARGKTVVIEAATSLNNPSWLPLSTNTLVEGSAYFSDAEWSNHPARFYRVRTP